MANLTHCDSDQEKRETEEKSSFATHKSFGIIRSLHRKISRSQGATAFSGHQKVETLEDYLREFQIQRSKAIAQFTRLQNQLI